MLIDAQKNPYWSQLLLLSVAHCGTYTCLRHVALVCSDLYAHTSLLRWHVSLWKRKAKTESTTRQKWVLMFLNDFWRLEWIGHCSIGIIQYYPKIGSSNIIQLYYLTLASVLDNIYYYSMLLMCSVWTFAGARSACKYDQYFISQHNKLLHAG